MITFDGFCDEFSQIIFYKMKDYQFPIHLEAGSPLGATSMPDYYNFPHYEHKIKKHTKINNKN